MNFDATSFASRFFRGIACRKSTWLLGLVMLCASPALAQVEFIGAQSTVGATGLSAPFGAAVDGAGNLYIADAANNRVVKISPKGTQTTVVTDPVTLSDPTGLGLDRAGNLFISDTGHNRVVKVSVGGGGAIFADVNTPGGLAVDGGGNVFVTDSQDKKIVKITSLGATSNFETGLTNPGAVAVDQAGNVYLADGTLSSVVEYTAANTPGTNVGSSLGSVTGVAVDNAGNVYVAESGEGAAIVEIPVGGGTQPTLPVNGLGAAELLAVDANYNLFIPDDANNAVVEFSIKTVNFGFANVCQGGTPTPCSQTAILKFEPLDDTITSVSTVTLGVAAGEFSIGEENCTDSSSLCSVTVTFAAQAPGMQTGGIVLGDSSLAKDVTFPLYGTGMSAEAGFDPAPMAGPIGTDGFQDPVALAIGGGVLNGPIYIADDAACQIFKMDFREEIILPIAGTGTCGFSGDGGAASAAMLNSPEDVAIDGAGNIYVADEVNSLIRKIDVNGIITTVAGDSEKGAGFSGDGGAATSAQLDEPFGIALDGAGNLYIADTINNRIRKVDLGGIITTVAGNGTNGYSGDGGLATSARLFEPFGVRADLAGNLFIADSGNNVVRKVDTTGKITTVAGNFAAGEGESGDGGPATSAQLAFPIFVSVDAAGELFIADNDSGVIRIVDPAGKISTYNAPTGFPADLVVDLFGNFAMIDPNAEAVTLVARFFSPQVSFGTQTVNTTSAAQDVKVTNIGNQTLDLVSITSPAGFSLNGPDTTCEPDSSLNLGLSCILGIQFAPTAATEYSDAVGLTDNSLGPVGVFQPVDVSGTGVVPLTPTTTALAAAPSTAFQGQTVTLTATVTPNPSAPMGSVDFCLGGSGPAVVKRQPAQAGRLQALRQWRVNAAAPQVSSCGGGTLLETVNVGANGIAVLTITNLPLGANSITAVYSGNGTLDVSTSDPVTVTINAPASTTTAIAISPNPGFDGQGVTLTGTVSPIPTSNPAGTITFCDSGSVGPKVRRAGESIGNKTRRAFGSSIRREGGGSPCGADAVLGTANVNAQGVATLTLTTLTVGDHNIYAVYSGAAGFSNSVSDPLDETVDAAYTVAAPQTPFDVAEGGAVQITVNVPPLGGAFNSVVTLAASGLPPGATATFNPPTVTPGANGAQTVMTIQLAASGANRTASLPASPISSIPAWPLAGMGMLVFALRFRRRSWPRLTAATLAIAALSVAAIALVGCNGGFAGLSTPKGQYIVTVTGTSGSLHPSTTVTVVVQ